MPEIDSAAIGGWLGSAMWPFFRIGAFFLAAPIFGTQLVPARVRIVLAFLMTLAIAPNLPPMPVVDAVSVSAFVFCTREYFDNDQL